MGRISTPDGKRKSLYAKTRGELGLKLHQAQGAVLQGQKLPSDRLTVAAHLESWLEKVARPSLRPRTFVSYKLIVEHHLKPALGRIALVRLGPETIEDYMRQKREAGLSSRTVQYHHAVLRRAPVSAERWGHVHRNAAKLVTPPKVERAEVQPMTPEQARCFLDSVKDDRLYPLYLVALSLGLRQGEALALRWKDVALGVGTLTIRATLQRYGNEYHLDAPKTKRSRRTLGLPTPVVDALRTHRLRQLRERVKAGPAWQDSWGLMFTTETGAPMSGNVVTHRFHLAMDAAGLPRQRFHDLRHDAATFLLAQGVELRVVMEILGHTTIAVTANTYAHVLPVLQQDAAEKMGRLLFGRTKT